MIFSKSFGYAIRSILYVAVMRDEKRYVQVEEIAAKLAVPRHFMGKIMKKLAKEKILISTKGPSGGFMLSEHTLEMPLMDLIVIIDGVEIFDTCALRAKECNADNPCPMHFQMDSIKRDLKSVLSETKIGGLLEEDKTEFIRSISTAIGIEPSQKISEAQKVY
ncbi:MAG TPA: Rrf2 family transcriptional regulator [Flavisolibacter sp.]|jgi:Rrf2 family transcriptional regulator, iron-sulfur cluster assembly transcription factor|nr:Rrf2 family transcriptional regulator [Flavisolibacter sp.]